MEDLFITIPATPAPIITKEMIKHTFLFPRKSMAFFLLLSAVELLIGKARL